LSLNTIKSALSRESRVTATVGIHWTHDAGVDIRAANAGDGEGTVPLLEQVQKVEGLEVETLLGDMAYSDGDLREAVAEPGVDLVAKVPPVTNGGRFPKTDFRIDNENKEVTCPAGNTTGDARTITDHKGRPATAYRFAPDTCVPTARCATSAPPPPRAARSSWAATTTASRRPEPARGIRRPRRCCVSGPRVERKSTTSRTCGWQGPLPGPAKNEAAGSACRDGRQLQTARRPRRVRKYRYLRRLRPKRISTFGFGVVTAI